jgi:hypothetical protein
VSNNFHESVEVDGLRDVGLEARSKDQSSVSRTDPRRYGNGRNGAMPLASAQFSNEPEAITIRHMDVACYQVAIHLFENAERVIGARDAGYRSAGDFQHLNDDVPGVLIVFDNKEAQTSERLLFHQEAPRSRDLFLPI